MVSVAVLALALTLAAPAAAASAPNEVRHGSGPGTGAVTRSIRITPRTSIQLVSRVDDWGNTRTSRPGWNATVVDARDLRRGDFVTVTTDDDQRDVAVALQIIRPGSR